MFTFVAEIKITCPFSSAVVGVLAKRHQQQMLYLKA
jgi:hypothetical protein